MKFTRAVMAAKTPMPADHTLYHLSPRGFWKKFRKQTPALLFIPQTDGYRNAPIADACPALLYHGTIGDVVVVNPEISSGLPLPDKNRYPQPGSRPEKYSTPATMASDVAQNPYWKRDVRRAYPQLSVITQEDYSKILIASPQAQSITAPGTSTNSVPAPAANLEVAPLSDVIGAIYAAQKAYSESKLPPIPPTSTKKWNPTREPDAPHAPHAYWPMKLYK